MYMLTLIREKIFFGKGCTECALNTLNNILNTAKIVFPSNLNGSNYDVIFELVHEMRFNSSVFWMDK